jgi:pimeloyl-ACP methyl ester carboxylesterase
MDDLKTLARGWASLPQIGSVHASGDGRWAFWCATGQGEVADVFCAPLSGGDGLGTEQLTFATDLCQIRDVSADGQVLILAQSGQGGGRDHLLLMDRKVGNRLHLLTPKQDSHHLHGGALTGDGKALIFAADFDYAKQCCTEGYRVWRQDLTSGTRQCLAQPAGLLPQAPLQSPSGQRILLHSHARGGGVALWLMNGDGTGLREVFSLGLGEVCRGLWLDEDRIVVIAERSGRDELGIFTLSSGTTQWLGGEPEIFPHSAVIGGKGGFVCLAHRNGGLRPVQFDAAGQRDFGNGSGRGSLAPVAGLPDGGWLALAYDAGAPDDLVRVAPDGICHSLMAQHRPRLRTVQRPQVRQHSRPRALWWEGADGRKVQGWLCVPQSRPLGLIVWLHDGPDQHCEDRAQPQIGFWLQQGYAVLAPNFRGSSGFGQSWRRAARFGPEGREIGDILHGIEAVLERGFAPRRVAVVGAGLGACAALACLAQAGDLVRAAVLIGPGKLPEGLGATLHRIRGEVLIFEGEMPDCGGPVAVSLAEVLAEAGLRHQAVVFNGHQDAILRRSAVETCLQLSATFVKAALVKTAEPA